jgi:iron(III) transport system substrate-binding protein
MIAYGLLVNTKAVKDPDVPKSWQDLLDPKWKGKILSDDMRAPGGGFVFFAATLSKFGRDFHEALAKQQPVFSRDPGQDQQRVARGEYPIRIPQVFSHYMLMGGLPVNMVIPQEGSPYIRFDLALAKNAPHPNAARVLINWYLSESAQVAFGDQASVPVMAGLEEKIKPGARRLASVPLLGTTNPATRDAELDLAKQIYK